MTVDGLKAFDVASHKVGDLTIVESEEVIDNILPNEDSLYSRLNGFVEGLQNATSLDELYHLLATDIRDITGFDRALVYRFDKNWHGTVVAEARNDVLPSYLDLRFPASDIPAQARELYRRNRMRIIPDASYIPVAINCEPTVPPTPPLDLSQSIIRSVSPVHVEYMRNMGTMASMSVSILIDDTLWGLISCHNSGPRRVPLRARNACDLLTRIFALQLSAIERGVMAEQHLRLATIQTRLLRSMAKEEQFLHGLVHHKDDVLALAEATGAAIVTNDACHMLGVTPSEADVMMLYAWLSAHHGEEGTYATNALADEYADARAFSAQASGLLAISISQKYDSYVLWFRPEVVQTVRWGGNPAKPAAPSLNEPLQLHPRKSFEAWRETVKGRSLPWTNAEVQAAKNLRAAVLGIVLRRAEELASVTEELQRANKELEAFSYSVSHDLRAPFRHIVGYSELLRSREGDRLTDRGRHYVDTLREAALSAGTLVDNLLTFSQMGRNSLNLVTVDLSLLMEEVRRKIMRDVDRERSIDWKISALGKVYVDPTMMRLAIENLFSNAIKYTRHRTNAVIEIGRENNQDLQGVFFVRDNGVGFDMTYVNKLFGVFQRLHRVEEYEGTGIGLANVRRIVERHGGQTWAEGAIDQGATFYFTLALREEARVNGRAKGDPSSRRQS